jgi:hypothetical protein
MKAAFKTLLALVVLAGVAVVAQAEDKDKDTKGDKKPVTLKGTLGCAKCVFKVKGCKVCTNAIKVEKDGKEVIYIIDDGGRKAKYHGKICTAEKKGSVTGVVGKKDGKDSIKPETDGVKFD